MKEYLIGTLLGINIMLIWFLGIHLTQTEARVRHLEDHRIMMDAQMLICADKVEGLVEEFMEEHLHSHGGGG